ncbi:MAG: 30S ribosomal protein S6 [Candidatus Colwellbacteria bacterium]|nr:30S ribosomal protein S6 [Candidatus Colwellbacteria bacterium]
METEKKTYEISFLARTEEGAGTVLKHLNQVGADITNTQQIEQINLAYPIKKHNSAYLGCVHFALQPTDVVTLRDALRFEEGILRYTIVTPPFIRVEEPQPRGPRVNQEAQIERPSTTDTVASNRDLEAKLEEITDSLEKEG